MGRLAKILKSDWLCGPNIGLAIRMGFKLCVVIREMRMHSLTIVLEMSLSSNSIYYVCKQRRLSWFAGLPEPSMIACDKYVFHLAWLIIILIRIVYGRLLKLIRRYKSLGNP